MKFNLDAIIGRNNYPGKKSEDSLERKEKEEFAFNNTESNSDYNKIKEHEAKNAVHPENRYNSVEEEEKIIQPESLYKTVDDVVDESQTEDSIIDLIDNKTGNNKEDERGIVEDNDIYGVSEILNKLLNTAHSKKDKEEGDNLVLRINAFTTEYQILLSSKLPIDQEEKAVNDLFKTHFGDVAYSGPDAELVNELKIVVKNAPKNHWRGEKITQPENPADKIKLKPKNEPDLVARFVAKKPNFNKRQNNIPERKIKIKW